MLSTTELVPAERPQSQAEEFDGLTVLVADAYQLFREGVKIYVRSVEPDVALLEAGSVASAIDMYRSCAGVDLVLLDSAMPGARSGSALDDFLQACPDARVVVVTDHHDMKSIQGALARGVLGFIPKSASKNGFTNALRFVLEGGTYIPPEALMAGSTAPVQVSNASAVPALSLHAAGGGPQSAGLTARQIDVLAQLLDGKPNKQICRELNLALGTVKCHVGAILGALEVNSRAEAIAAANKRGWRQWIAQPPQSQQAGRPAA